MTLGLYKNMDVSIVIVNYNTLQMTLDCINSVYEQTKEIDFEVILVDNASLDGSKEFFEQDKRIKYLYNSQNLGFGRANNRALEICSGRNILFLNSDTLLTDNSVKKLSDYLDENQDVGACGGNLYFVDGSPIHSFRRIFPSVLDSVDILLFHMISKILYGKNSEHNFSNLPIKVAYITGADLMIRKNLLLQLKGFDSRFFMYYEETELCRRISRLGYSIMAIPETYIIHHESKSVSLNSGSIKKMRMLNRSKRLYLNIQCEKISKTLIDFLWIITVVSRIVLLFFSKKHRDIWICHLRNSMPWCC